MVLKECEDVIRAAAEEKARTRAEQIKPRAQPMILSSQANQLSETEMTQRSALKFTNLQSEREESNFSQQQKITEKIRSL
jgi:hypothetical protein